MGEMTRGQFSSAAEQAVGNVSAGAVVCSPHYDDAVLSCWSVLDGEEQCRVVNVFTGAPREGFTSWFDQVGGASSSASHMRRRSTEDRDALECAGRTSVDLGLLEVQYRLRQSPWLHGMFRRAAPIRFAMLRMPFLQPALFATPTPGAGQIADAILQAAPGASMLCMPAGIGGHRDHLAVRAAGALLASRGIAVRLYADLPYAVMHGWPAWVAAPDGERVRDRACTFWARHLEALRAQVGDPVRQANVVRLSPEQQARKRSAVRRYASQIDALNAGRTRGRMDEESTFAYEVYWELSSQAGGAR